LFDQPGRARPAHPFTRPAPPCRTIAVVLLDAALANELVVDAAQVNPGLVVKLPPEGGEPLGALALCGRAGEERVVLLGQGQKVRDPYPLLLPATSARHTLAGYRCCWAWSLPGLTSVGRGTARPLFLAKCRPAAGPARGPWGRSVGIVVHQPHR